MYRSKAIAWSNQMMEACLCLMILCLPFSKAAIEVFAWNAFFFWLLKRALGYRTDGPGRWLPRSPVNAVLGWFLVVNALSVVFSAYPATSLAAFFGKQLKYMAIYVTVIEAVSGYRPLKNILAAMAASSILVLVVAALQYAGTVDILADHRSDRLTSVFSSANGFSAWLIVMIPLFCSLAASQKEYFSGRSVKMILFILAVLLSLSLLLTYSRGAWVGLGAALIPALFYGLLRLKLRVRLIWAAVSLALALLVLFLPLVRDNVGSIARTPFRSGLTLSERISAPKGIKIRLRLWQEALIIIKEHPLVGSGLNTYAKIAPKYKKNAPTGAYSHNSFLQMAAEIGIIGLAVFVALLVVFFNVIWNGLIRRKNMLTLGLTTAVLAFLIHAVFDSHLYALQLAALFWFVFGLSVAVTNFINNAAGEPCP